ncbi:MAG TPA: outer membrane protein transport protein, partial [Verrucomicrobiota bacterium]|nr:outer membrane protein transport protein [Verrucomicrobiota bacterium]
MKTGKQSFSTHKLIRPALALAAMSPVVSYAGGISLYEIATPDVGLASAGYAARADDASTVFKNPAGMSRLTDAQLQSGAQLLYADLEFSPNSGTSTSGGDGGNAVGALPAASLFVTIPLNEKVTVGFGSCSYFGLALDYDNDWVGRYYVRNASLIGMSLLPSASYKVNDWLSLGAGLNAMYGMMETKVAVNNPEPSQGDGSLRIKDEDWGFGGNFGILIMPDERTRIGVTYLSAVCLDFEDKPKFNNLGPGLGAIFANPNSLDLGMTVPQQVMVSVYRDLNEKWALMANVGWQDWSAFGKVDVSVDSSSNPDVTANLN